MNKKGKSTAKKKGSGRSSDTEAVSDVQSRQLPVGLPPEFEPLTLKQKLFVVNYAVTRNGVKAVEIAGYEGNYNTLHAMAVENLRKPTILLAFDAYMRPEFEKQGVSVARTIQHIADIAYSPWSDHLTVKEKKGRIVSVHMQMSAKIKALEILTKMLRLTSDKETDIQQFIDSSQNIHVHAKTPDEARKALLDFLRKHR